MAPEEKQNLDDHTQNRKASDQGGNQDLDPNVPVVGCELSQLELIRTLRIAEDTLLSVYVGIMYK